MGEVGKSSTDNWWGKKGAALIHQKRRYSCKIWSSQEPNGAALQTIMELDIVRHIRNGYGFHPVFLERIVSALMSS